MKIESIHIENFRQYKGPIDFKFSLDNDKNFTVVRGTNGAGKTNLLNAITWCLYDDELHKSDKKQGGPIYNLITKNEIKPNESFDVIVKIVMVDDYDIKITFTRSLEFSCDSKGNISKRPMSEFHVENSFGEVERPNLFINKLLPQNIEGYFFFDGEKLEEYFDENSEGSIKNSVYELAQLNLLDSAISNLESVQKEYAKEIRRLDKDLGGVIENKSILEARLRKWKSKREEADDIIYDLDAKLDSLRLELKQIDNADLKALKRERKRLNKDKTHYTHEINKLKSKKRKTIIEKFPMVCGYKAMRYTCEKCEEEKNNNIGSLYSEDLLEHILKENKCICGCDLSNDDHAKKTVQDLIKHATTRSDISNEVKMTLRDVNSFMLEISKVNDNIKDYNLNIEVYEKDLADVNEEIEFNKFNSERIDESAIRKLNIQINDLERKRDGWISKRTEAEIKHDETKRELSIIEDKVARRKTSDRRVKQLRKDDAICGELIKNLILLKDNVNENIRSKVETATTEQFKKLMWKDNFEKVIINNRYDVRIRDVVGEVVSPGILSAGEKLVLALSFVAALNSISGFDLPVIIDTPMGRLDQEMKINISNTLPKYMENKQVTLLVTGEEYTDSFRKGILDKVNYEYRIVVDETENGTESRIVENE